MTVAQILISASKFSSNSNSTESEIKEKISSLQEQIQNLEKENLDLKEENIELMQRTGFIQRPYSYFEKHLSDFIIKSRCSVEKDENTQDKYKMIEAKVGFIKKLPPTQCLW